jgi:AhpD family alkylhydroperoxidase
MHTRFSPDAAPGAYEAMLGLERYLKSSSIEERLLHLIKLRASQINGCAYCLDMHWKDLEAIGETPLRMYSLDAWRECPYYSDRERAALAWTESVTLISETHAPDDVYEQVRAQFSDAETVNLTMLIGAINAWNRLAIAFRAVHPVKVKASVA